MPGTVEFTVHNDAIAILRCDGYFKASGSPSARRQFNILQRRRIGMSYCLLELIRLGLIASSTTILNINGYHSEKWCVYCMVGGTYGDIDLGGTDEGWMKQINVP